MKDLFPTQIDDAISVWNKHCQYIISLSETTPKEERDKAVTLCVTLHDGLQCVMNEAEYAMYLSVYAGLLSIDSDKLADEIKIQQELLAIRRKQVVDERNYYLPRLSGCLSHLAYAQLRAGQGDAAIASIEEAVGCERSLVEENINVSNNRLPATLYMQAHIYRHLLSDKTEYAYKEALAAYDTILSQGDDGEMIIRETMADIAVELADYYLADSLVEYAVDRYLQSVDNYRVVLSVNDAVASKLLAVYTKLLAVYTAMKKTQKAEYYARLVANISQEIEQAHNQP